MTTHTVVHRYRVAVQHRDSHNKEKILYTGSPHNLHSCHCIEPNPWYFSRFSCVLDGNSWKSVLIWFIVCILVRYAISISEWNLYPKSSVRSYTINSYELDGTLSYAADAIHYNDVIMSMIASQITNLTIVYSTVYSGADQRKHQSSASLAFVQGIHRGPGASNAKNVSIWWRHHDNFHTTMQGHSTVTVAGW